MSRIVVLNGVGSVGKTTLFAAAPEVAADRVLRAIGL